MVQFRDHSVELLSGHLGGDIDIHSSKGVGKETPIGPVSWARGGDVLKAECQATVLWFDPLNLVSTIQPEITVGRSRVRVTCMKELRMEVWKVGVVPQVSTWRP